MVNELILMEFSVLGGITKNLPPETIYDDVALNAGEDFCMETYEKMAEYDRRETEERTV